MEKARKKGLDILRQVSKHTLPFIFRYFAFYVDILFGGCFEEGQGTGNRTIEERWHVLIKQICVA